MPRSFFDIHDDDDLSRDDEGVELANIEMVRHHAKTVLPDIARDEMPANGDRRIDTVLVTAEDGHPTCSATLSFVGMWLVR